jgi:hypothetical protein
LKGKKTTRKTPRPITTGQLNRLIDVFVHPLFKKDERYIWLDGLLHGLAERDPQASIGKFAKYSVPILLKRKPTRKAHRRRKRNCLAGR